MGVELTSVGVVVTACLPGGPPLVQEEPCEGLLRARERPEVRDEKQLPVLLNGERHDKSTKKWQLKERLRAI